MDRSWMGKNRGTSEYKNGVVGFLNFVAQHAETPNFIWCPCTMCVNTFKGSPEAVKDHLDAFGIDQRYTTWVRHGETFCGSSSHLGRTNDIDVQVPTYQFEQGVPDDAPEMVQMVQDTHDEFSSDPKKFERLIKDAESPLYDGCDKFTRLSTVVKLYNLKAKNGWSDKSFSDLLSLLKEMLPAENNLPVSMYEAKKILNSYGMEYEKIHACPNDCILYRKQYENDSVCPTCNTSRWKMNERTSKPIEGVPAKVLFYFPPIPRFKRMFQSVERAEKLIWHAQRKEDDGILRHPADSSTWKLVDHLWPTFGNEPRNLRLALSTDGINPHGSMSSRYSCWPVLMAVYNLPSWLCMKRKYMMLTMLISGPQQPGNDIDVYFAPLLEDLQLLWKGVEAFDAFQRQSFTLRAAVLWTINDFPAYGTLSGCKVKGYFACPICAKKTFSVRLKHSKKNVYIGHRRFLPSGHAFRRQKKAFNGEKEDGKAPIPLSGEEVFKEVENIKNVWGKKKTKNGRKLGKSKRKDASNVYWKKKTWLFELEYWKYLPVRHQLDVMHIEKNVAESTIGTLLNIPGKSKDGLNARLDLSEMGLRTELTPEIDKESNSRTYLPPACYTTSKDEKRRLCQTVFDIKVPDGYSSNLRNRVSMQDLKFYGMKSHDYHVLMQEFLPLAIRSILPKHVRYAITRLCFFFKALCSKEVDINKLREIQSNLIVTLCLLEKYFPPSFFDIMIHLTVHLVREVRLCGPVYFRWMYPFERFMKVLKGYVRNRYRPEGCMAECYIAEEAIEFCSEYLSDMETIGVPSDRNADSDMASLVSEGKPLSGGSVVDVDYISWSRAHRTVLENTTEVLPYIEKHMTFLKKKYPNRSTKEKWLQEEHNRTFIDWIREQVEDELKDPNNNISKELKWIAHGPNHHVIKYHGYVINGYRYHTKARDMVRTCQNSGIKVVAGGMHVAGAKDQNPIFAESCYYGTIDEIWLLDYNILKIPVFKCNWVDSASGIQTDELGFKLVQLDNAGHKTDPFILASHVKQVFYVEDQLDPKWSIVLSMPQKDYLFGLDDDEVYDFDGNPPFNNVLPNIDTFDTTDDSQSAYVRKDGERIYIDTIVPDVGLEETQGEANVQAMT